MRIRRVVRGKRRLRRLFVIGALAALPSEAALQISAAGARQAAPLKDNAVSGLAAPYRRRHAPSLAAPRRPSDTRLRVNGLALRLRLLRGGSLTALTLTFAARHIPEELGRLRP